MVSYNGAPDIDYLIALNAVEYNTSTDERSEYLGERRPLASFPSAGAREDNPVASARVRIDAVNARSSAIVVSDLTVVRGGREILGGLSLEVVSGSVTGLLGPSGCGKSTLMRSIVGVQIVASGTVMVLGEAAGTGPLRRRVGYVTQAPSVYADLSVEENLRFFASVLGADKSRIAEVVKTVGLAGFEDRVVGGLSGGQHSRVSLATALLGRPDLLVLDEPTVGLDPVLRAELWKTFHQLASEGTTLLISSHVMDEAAECNAILLMRDGGILRQTTPDGLRSETGESDLSRAFLALIERETPSS
jgi:ABC-2 type transport system ATP-binding protein